MARVSGFDLAANTYDSNFTNTAIGKLQRKEVYNLLMPFLENKKPLDILELNCGTGEDALLMAKKGHKVLATDLSKEMLMSAQAKADDNLDLRFQQLDINNLNTLASTNLDLIFSNFGGLNCISPEEFREFFLRAREKVVPGGHIIAVIMSKRCLWEQVYYLIKGDSKKAYRRKTKGPIEVQIKEEKIATWYYDPKEIMGYAQPDYAKVILRPVGFLIPPSYLNSYFKNKKGVLNILAWLDRKLFFLDFLSAYADHYILALQKK